jgi:hypothetical protein
MEKPLDGADVSVVAEAPQEPRSGNASCAVTLTFPYSRHKI